MNEIKELDALIKKVSEKVNESILNRDYRLVERGEHTCTIEVYGELFRIWMTNSPDNTRIYEINKYDMNVFYLEIKFKKPSTCRKILQEKTDEEKEADKKKACEEIKRLQKIVDCED